MHMQFCGAAGEVTGSCTKLDLDDATLLIDCGLFQGGKYADDRNYDPFPFKAEDIDAVILTHAHLDHCGRLPKLINQGFMGKIYATDATRDLTALILLDAAGIMQEEAEQHNHPPLYTDEDVAQTVERFMSIPYDRSVEVAPGVIVTLHNAGHVLGSSFIEVKSERKSAIFSGDIGNYPVPLLPQAEDLPATDALILESTYGDKLHGKYEEGVKLLEQAIRDTMHDNGVLLIPAFSLERTQELITVIDKALTERRIPEMSAYLDGPLGIRICRVYEEYDHYFNHAAQLLQKHESDQTILKFPSLTFTETSEQSKLINDVDPPKLIIAGSGMMHGGRILHHLKRYLGIPTTRLLIVGHQVQGSLGRRLLDGEKKVIIHGETVEAKATILSTHAFSSHMDQDQLLTWLKTMPQKPKVIFLNHGDTEARETFSTLLKEEIESKVYLPQFGDGFTLGGEEDPALLHAPGQVTNQSKHV